MSVRPPVRRWFFFTAGPTTFTATSTSRPCSPPPATGPSSRICAATARHGSSRATRRETGSRPLWLSDVIALMDALAIDRAIVTGFDWGARTANIVAALWPNRCKAMVSVSGYLIGSRAANRMPLPPRAELEWWYQYLLRDGPRPGGLREVPSGVCQADLADRVTEVALRRCDVRAHREGVRQSGSRERGDPQLPMAARAG